MSELVWVKRTKAIPGILRHSLCVREVCLPCLRPARVNMTSTIDTWSMSVLSKHCNALESEDKRKRKRALEELRTILFDENSIIATDIKIECVYKNVLKCFGDTAEACRELAASIIIELLKTIPEHSDHYFPYIMPILVQRLANKEIIESSEEVRLLLVNLYHGIIQKFRTSLGNYVEEIVQILVKILTDPFPKIKKESCDCVGDLSKAIPRQLYTHTASLLTPLLQNYTHQHSRVRVAAVQATEELMVRGDCRALEEALVPMAERFFDQAPAVRRAATAAVGRWTLEMPDRYSYFARLLPLQLTGLQDAVPEVREEAARLWAAAGRQYATENEQDLKDKLDFLSEEAPAHYPPGVRRPGLGCRELVCRFLHPMVPMATAELRDWRPDVRLRAAQLTRELVLHAEERATHYLPALADALAAATGDEDPRVIESAEAAAELLGWLVPAETWLQLLLPEPGDAPIAGRLRVLGCALRGADPEQLAPRRAEVAALLSTPDTCLSPAHDLQLATLACCEAMLPATDCVHDLCEAQLFLSLLSLQAVATEASLAQRALEAQRRLGPLEHLHRTHVPGLLVELAQGAHSWSPCAPQRLLLDTLLEQAGSAVALALEPAATLLTEALRPHLEPERRLRGFTCLAQLLTQHPTVLEPPGGPTFAAKLLEDVLMPALVWKTGRTAEALRTAAAACLLSVLEAKHRVEPPAAEQPVDRHCQALPPLLPLLASLLEDSSQRSRVLALHCAASTCSLLHISHILTCDQLVDLYPVVLKRLDDVDDEVRASTVRTLTKLFALFAEVNEAGSYNVHLESLYSTLLVHLDDPDAAFRLLVLSCLKNVGNYAPELLQLRAQAARSSFRSPSQCDELVAHLQTLALA